MIVPSSFSLCLIVEIEGKSKENQSYWCGKLFSIVASTHYKSELNAICADCDCKFENKLGFAVPAPQFRFRLCNK
jgi:hypothetical protein